ncbi:helix-turn-helix domain-containing protein [uncultured Lacinutrix sp.]|uniref:AraC family transcriptional regulator n=1 Tax=uncultured Lacinutrix sp. TaxID=574032 RepID=UPI002625CD7C|nr:helix-turn-helix domain-containing protein [uncultured Lacinutrix sp.]
MKKKQTKHIKFQNQQNTRAHFDIVKLEELYQRTDLDHSIEAHHKVEFYILLFIEKGNGFHAIDFTDYKCSKGTLLTIRKDQIHKFFKSQKLKGSLLLFTNEFLVSYLEKIEAQKTMLLFNEQLGVPKIQLSDSEFKNIQQIIKRINDEYFSVNDGHSLSIIRSELHILITKLFRIKSEGKQFNFEKKYLNEFIEFQRLVEKNVNKTLKIKDFASLMGVSTKTINTITKNIVNKSAKQFVDEISTKQIKRLLLNTNLSIKEIAYKSGFEETTNFYKYFKRQTETTPEQFRIGK